MKFFQVKFFLGEHFFGEIFFDPRNPKGRGRGEGGEVGDGGENEVGVHTYKYTLYKYSAFNKKDKLNSWTDSFRL